MSAAGKPTLGYIGTGLIGGPMTQRLLAAGYDVTVWNRTRSKLEPLVAAGATPADTIADVARAAEIVMMCVTDAAAAEQVAFGPDGLADGGAAGKIVVDFSSIRPDTTRDIAQRLADKCGMAWIDAPVSGGVQGAADGTLAIMCGGDAEAVERVRPVVMNLCGRFTHMGGSGAGQTTKLCNQIISGTAIAVIAEAVNFAERAGIDATQLAEALAGGWGDSKPLQTFAPRMAARQYEPLLGQLYTLLKDVDTATDLAKELQAPLPIASTTAEIMRVMAGRGQADEDPTRLVEIYAGSAETD